MNKIVSVVFGFFTLVIMLMPTATFAATNAPECVTFKASPSAIKAGESSNLSWTTKNGTRIAIEPDIFDSNKSADAKKGSVVVKPKKDTKYTLTIYRSGRKDTCTVIVKVNGSSSSPTSGITAYTTRDQQALVTLPIAQLPYTGYDASSFLTTLFFALALAWLLAVGYVVAIKKRSLFGIGTEGNPTTLAGAVIPHTEYRHKVASFISSTDQKN